MTISFRGYQEYGADWMANRFGGVLGDQVGLGKTATSLLACDYAKVKNVLVISPLPVKPWWIKEIGNVEGVNFVTDAAHAPRVQTGQGKIYTLAHYNQFRSLRKGRETIIKEPSEITQQFLDIEWDAILCDEIHFVKNRKSQRTRWIKKLKTTYKWGLSGSPIAEYPDDAWSILNWFNRKEFRGYWPFVELYCIVDETWFGGKPQKQLVGINPQRLEMFHQALEPYFLVRKRVDVGIELPPLTTQTIPIVLPKKQRKFYQDVKKKAVIELKQQIGDVLDLTGNQRLWIKSGGARFVRLQQTASAPTVFEVYPHKENGKLDWLRDYVEGAEPCLILTRFRHTADKIQEIIPEGWLAGTYEALGTGLNLQHYATLIAYDPPKSRLDWEQAQGRIERLGQERPMTVIRLVATNTIDEHSWEAIDRKQSTVDTILGFLRKIFQEKT